MKNKKKMILISAAAVIAVAAVVTGGVIMSEKKKTDFYKSQPLMLPDGFTCTAHTGCVGTEDNSLESIEKAVEFGADIVEFDLNFTAEGIPVLSHDEPKGDEVTLDDAFKKVSEYKNLKVNVDIKSCAALDKVAPLAEKYGILDRVFYTGVFEHYVESVKADSPEVEYYLNIDVEKISKHSPEYLASLVETVRENGAIGINMNKNNATKELVNFFHDNGLLVSVWTVNEENDMHKILYFAPDNITTRNPDTLGKILNK